MTKLDWYNSLFFLKFVETNKLVMKEIEKKLKYMRYRHLAGLFLFMMIHMVCETYSFGDYQTTYILIPIYIALLALLAFFVGRIYYIYDFLIVDEDVEIQLVNIYGKTKTLDFTINELHEIALKEESFWRSSESLRMHVRYAVKEFTLIKCGLGEQIIQELTPRIKQN